MSIRSNVDARRLDQRVTIQRVAEVQDSSGDITPTWSELVECWACIDAEKATGEPYRSDSIQSVGQFVVWVRADIVQRFNVQVRDRIVWGSRVLDVKDVRDQQLRGRLTALMCQVGQNDG